MPKVWIDVEEDWPVYYLTPDQGSGTFEVDLSDDQIARLRTVANEWTKIQAEVHVARLKADA